ncbi:MAG: tRNA pseudouridine(38-40) synthase TruA [Flavobacteriaceae bacterium]
MRYFVQFSYDGSAYHGWQRQPSDVSVQQIMEESFSTLLGRSVELVGAGRTDAGVHAREMFAHFDVAGCDTDDLVYRLNAFLPKDVAIKDIFQVGETAHARFDALERTYEYWVVQEKNPFLFDFAHYVRHPLDIEKMNEAAHILLEHTDFECFSKSRTDVKTFLCDIRRAQWEKKPDKWVFTIVADRFLRNMVRAVVGTLLEVGLGKNPPHFVNDVIKSGNRSMAGPSVPAKGLYLTKVLYPKTIMLHG